MKSIKMMMAAILLCGTMSAQAQDYYETKHEIGISIGGASNSQIMNSMENFTAVGASLGTVTYSNKSEIPTFSVDYYYHVTKGVAVGGILAVTGRSQDIMFDGTKSGEAKRTTISVLPAVKFDWLRKKNFGMYSKFGIGLSMLSDSQKKDNGEKLNSDTRWYVNFQASLLGAEVGSENIRGFAELGYGEQGIGQIGLRFKF